MAQPPIILITGSSDGGLGSSLAVAFHQHGRRVLATARNVARMTGLQNLGIETITLDVFSNSSINSCVEQVTALTASTSGGLDILINNAGGGYNMPVADIDIAKAKSLFDLNVWSYIAVMQAFLPLLLQAKDMIVNNTSISSIAPNPFLERLPPFQGGRRHVL
jgi:1-acylglycerone phosphate reductase